MRQLKLISDTHPAKIAWEILLITVILFSSVTVPYRLTFNYDQIDLYYWLITAVFVIDIAINLNTSIRIGELVITDRKEIASRYFKSGFVVDVIAAIPFAVLPPMVASLAIVLPLLRLLKLRRLNGMLQHIQEVFLFNPSIARLSAFFCWSILLVHFISIGWVSIGAGEQDGTEFHRYLMALYWAVSTASTIGYGDIIPDHNKHIQIIYTMCVQLLGVSMFGYIVGNISSIITNIDVAKAKFMQKMEDLNAFFRAYSIPPSIQSKAHGYYRYIWETHGTVELEQSVVQEMPDSLREEVLLHLHAEVIQKVTMFRNMSEEFIRRVVHLLEPLVFLPRDFIIRQGEYGDCMYFLLNGDVDVIVNGQKVAQLSSGSPFGETALLQQERRNASIQTLGYCDVYKLSKFNFDVLRERFPEFDSQVKETVASRVKG